jgi:Protein of unknown function (DUF2630)
MQDQDILSRIGQLVDEEHRLLQLEQQNQLPDPDHKRRRELEIALDQCWDLLRQRRARREFGQNPDEVSVRPADVVEKYQQ